MIDRFKVFSTWLAQLSWLERLWLLAPIAVWFSYSPRISFGGDSTMNYELSVVLIYITILAIAGVPTIWRHRQQVIHSKHIWILTAYVVWSVLTVIWSPNSLRGFLTAGILGLVYLVLLAAWSIRIRLRSMLPIMANLFIGAAVIACFLSLAQMVAGTYIQSRSELGLCAGCVAGQFGFVRPNLFAIEPQFLGSLLLAPTLIVYYRLIAKRRSWANSLIFILLATTLGLTLSRGAIYACGVGMVVMWLAIRKHWLNKLATVDLIIVVIVACLGIQGGLAAINPYIHETFWGAIAKSVNHLSLGVIDFRNNHESVDDKTSESHFPADSSLLSTDSQQLPAYDGYVAESTDVRVNLTKTALAAWSEQDLPHRLFGTGLGSAGIVMAQQTGSSYQKEIVQNEYVEVLLERGMVGFLLFVVAIGSTLYQVWRRGRQALAWPILAAYLVQWCFFSGLPNALHIYLIASWLIVL